MRGEYNTRPASIKNSAELPPRARRIPRQGVILIINTGTTSACAENTYRRHQTLGYPWNYLRVRGEYRLITSGLSCFTELPPRARRILTTVTRSVWPMGTTSACAENTCLSSGVWSQLRNYLRVRGEYYIPVRDTPRISELPPRARRILGLNLFNRAQCGTTSACAENTKPAPPPGCSSGNYLRVRGEYQAGCGAGLDSRELPPRARRIL